MNPLKIANSLRILYYGACWPTNIGNAFIDLGALATLRAAVPNATIGIASEIPRWLFSDGLGQQPSRGSAKPSSAPEHLIDNALDVAAISQCDAVVFSGMAMCDTFVRVNGPTIKTFSSRSIPVLLLGTGCATYDEAERRAYTEFLRTFDCIGFISRDDPSFEAFAGTVAPSIRGIDCGFFLPYAYEPFPLDFPSFSVVNFDDSPEPVLELRGMRVVRTHHSCFGPTASRQASQPNTLISDMPFDYLSLYARAEEVHSDRVHACVAALAYGRRAKLYSTTPRAHLFDPVGASEIRQGLVALDIAALERKRRMQIDDVRRIFEQRFGRASDEEPLHVRSRGAFPQ